MALDRITPAKSSPANGSVTRLSIREEQKQRTRDRLLDAAYEVFGEVGFRAATIDEIMKRAGANRATFYLHFSDKIDIAAAIGRRASMAVSDRFRQLDKMESPSCADVRAWLETDFNHRRDDKVLVNITQEASSADPRFGQEYMDYFVRVAERVMVNTVGRWPEEQRPMARMKIACLFAMLHRVEFHLLCQELDFGAYDPLGALAELIWKELFTSAPSASA
jgi:AcrR family transcriptional regulator